MADGTPSLRCVAHREAVSSVPSVSAVPSVPLPEENRCRVMSQYRGKSGEKRIWRCGKMCQNSGYCEYHEAHLRDKNERRREKYHAKKENVGVK